MRPLIDVTGKVFGRLTVLRRSEMKVEGAVKWLCRCECGKEVLIRGASLRSGNTSSCGCLLAEYLDQMKDVVCSRKTRKVWSDMKNRCFNSKASNFKRYGGRGITVCDRWMDIGMFVADMGEAPDGMFLDRKDNDGNYEPSNCRWATRTEQQNNTRSNILVEFSGERLTLKDWSRKTGLPYHVVKKRINKGWAVERALTLPVDAKKSHGHAQAR